MNYAGKIITYFEDGVHFVTHVKRADISFVYGDSIKYSPTAVRNICGDSHRLAKMGKIKILTLEEAEKLIGTRGIAYLRLNKHE